MEYIVVIALVILLLYICHTSLETFTNVDLLQPADSITTSLVPHKDYRYKRCEKYIFPKLEENIIGKFIKVTDKSWDIWYPCGYTHVEEEILKNEKEFASRNEGYVFGMTGADNLAAKDKLWKSLEKKYGRLRSTIFVPQTWVTYSEKDVAHFLNYAKSNPGKMYIMKKNIQRQQGLHITTNPAEVRTAFSKGYVVMQEIYNNPYKIAGRKINLRIYVLLVCKNGKKSAYVFDDGFIYYSKIPYTTGATRDEIITTGYADRSVYEKNPLTVQDFLSYLNRTHHGRESSRKFVSMRDYVLAGIFAAMSDSVCTNVNTNLTFAQIYGVDMQPNGDLSDIKVIEINKGPDAGAKDARDGIVKQRMLDSMYRVLGIGRNLDRSNSGFKRIWTNANFRAADVAI